MNNQAKAQFEYYIEHQDRFVGEYDGKAIILKDFEVVGLYDVEWEAAKEALRRYVPGTFIVQQVSPGPEAYVSYIAPSIVVTPYEP